MGGRERIGNQVFDVVVRLISLPEGGSSSPLSTETACDSRGFSRHCTHFYCDFFFSPLVTSNMKKLCLWLVFNCCCCFLIVQVEQMAKASRTGRRKVITR